MQKQNPFLDSLQAGFREQRMWRVPHATWFFLMTLGGGLYVLRWILGLNLGSVLGLPLVDITALVAIGIGGNVLVADLGRPLRLLKALKNVRTSWISVGAVADAIFVIAKVVYLAPRLDIQGFRPFLVLSGIQTPMVDRSLITIAGISALVVMIYAGLVLSSSRAIPFWRSPFIPAQFFFSGFSTAVALLLIMSFTLGQSLSQHLTTLKLILIATLILTLLCSVVRLLVKQPVADYVSESVDRLVKGNLAKLYLIGVLVIGHIIPLLITMILFSEDVAMGLLAVGVMVLIGGFLLRHTTLRAGLFPPLL